MEQTLEAPRPTTRPRASARPRTHRKHVRPPSTSTTRSTISAAPTPDTSSASPRLSTPRCAQSQPTEAPSIRSAAPVLAASNIADELCTARQRQDQLANLAGTMQNSQQSVRNRAGFIGHLLDEVLEDRKAELQGVNRKHLGVRKSWRNRSVGSGSLPMRLVTNALCLATLLCSLLPSCFAQAAQDYRKNPKFRTAISDGKLLARNQEYELAIASYEEANKIARGKDKRLSPRTDRSSDYEW